MSVGSWSPSLFPPLPARPERRCLDMCLPVPSPDSTTSSGLSLLCCFSFILLSSSGWLSPPSNHYPLLLHLLSSPLPLLPPSPTSSHILYLFLWITACLFHPDSEQRLGYGPTRPLWGLDSPQPRPQTAPRDPALLSLISYSYSQASWGLALEIKALAQSPLDTRAEGPPG